MEQRALDSGAFRRQVSRVLDDIIAGRGSVVVRRFGRPVAAVISFEDFQAVQQALEDAEDTRQANAVMAAIREGREQVTSLEDCLAEWEAEDDEETSP